MTYCSTPAVCSKYVARVELNVSVSLLHELVVVIACPSVDNDTSTGRMTFSRVTMRLGLLGTLFLVDTVYAHLNDETPPFTWVVPPFSQLSRRCRLRQEKASP